MSDTESADRGDTPQRRAEDRDELRTIGFRMREVQRLLAARVEQENRRLEAEGLEPVDESRFVGPAERSE